MGTTRRSSNTNSLPRQCWVFPYRDCSVADPNPDPDPPDPDPPDPRIFGPPGSGSGSISLRCGPDPSIIKQKYRSKKNLISTVLWLLFDFLPLKNYVKVPSQSSMQKNIFFLISFLLAS
jgi:hypothetical protein